MPESIANRTYNKFLVQLQKSLQLLNGIVIFFHEMRLDFLGGRSLDMDFFRRFLVSLILTFLGQFTTFQTAENISPALFWVLYLMAETDF
jgi:hypothetical protein